MAGSGMPSSPIRPGSTAFANRPTEKAEKTSGKRGAGGSTALRITVDHATGAWHGNVGVVTTLVRRAAFDPEHTLAMLCGPEVMMRFTVAALRDAGVARERVYLSMERNMKCALGHCGHCQFGADFLCRDGPVVRYDRVRERLAVREV